MALFHESLSDELTAFIGRQKIFFVATATAGGRINVSPKGLDTLRILDPRRIAYLDLTGSGAETAAHVRDDGRVTLMFCSFEAEPQILRIYGRGELIGHAAAAWPDLAAGFPALPGARGIVVIAIESLQTSCGAGVPLFDYVGQRDELLDWLAAKGRDGVEDYRRRKNRVSIDGLSTGLVDEAGV